MWIAEYARLLDKTVEGAKDSIRRFIQRAYRIDEDLVAPRERSESPLGSTDDEDERRSPSEESARTSSEDPAAGIPVVVHQAIDITLSWARTQLPPAGLSRADEVTVVLEEVLDQSDLRTLDEPQHLVNGIFHRIWLPKYAALLGITTDEALGLVFGRLEDVNRRTDPEAAGTDGSSGSVEESE